MSYIDLAALIKEKTGVEISYESLRAWELNDRPIRIDHIEAIAAVDPLKRGRYWLAWGVDDEEPKPDRGDSA